jgi:hypothetical protein
MALITPFWFPARQGKSEEVGPDTYRLTGPNLREAFISVHQDNPGRWSAHLRLEKDGPDVGATGPDFTTVYDAWEAAFELYRKEVVV